MLRFEIWKQEDLLENFRPGHEWEDIAVRCNLYYNMMRTNHGQVEQQRH